MNCVLDGGAYDSTTVSPAQDFPFSTRTRPPASNSPNRTREGAFENFFPAKLLKRSCIAGKHARQVQNLLHDCGFTWAIS